MWQSLSISIFGSILSQGGLIQEYKRILKLEVISFLYKTILFYSRITVAHFLIFFVVTFAFKTRQNIYFFCRHLVTLHSWNFKFITDTRWDLEKEGEFTPYNGGEWRRGIPRQENQKKMGRSVNHKIMGV